MENTLELQASSLCWALYQHVPKGGAGECWNPQTETLGGFYTLYSIPQILIFQGLPQVRLGRKII